MAILHEMLSGLAALSSAHEHPEYDEHHGSNVVHAATMRAASVKARTYRS